jgi:site-specific recombinase XerD
LPGSGGLTTIQKPMSVAAKRAGFDKPCSPRMLRLSFATRLLQSGSDILTVRELLGHSDVSTPMINSHVLNRGGRGIRSPLHQIKTLATRCRPGQQHG